MGIMKKDHPEQWTKFQGLLELVQAKGGGGGGSSSFYLTFKQENLNNFENIAKDLTPKLGFDITGLDILNMRYLINNKGVSHQKVLESATSAATRG